ncbi:MAG TPA: WG repeat-containing protein [Puia sp.]|nr:WG repeat-containing protein [Puia sp.]
MTTQKLKIVLVIILLSTTLAGLGQQANARDVLISFADTVTNESGYKDLAGDIVIPLGKYSFCFTDTFRTYAIVAVPQKGFVAIDRQEKILYEVFPFDNGPDYPSDGLFRIIIKNKIGYADASTGKIVINPQFACAWPFEHRVAKVSIDCKKQSAGEHYTWLSNSWYYINKAGKKVTPPTAK